MKSCRRWRQNQQIATTSTLLVSVTNDDNIPAQREKLAILVSTGKSKEAIGNSGFDWKSQRGHRPSELNKDYIITQELSTLAGGLALRFGRFLALANTALITAKHIVFETPPNTPTPTHPTRDSDGYPLEGVDEVGSDFIAI